MKTIHSFLRCATLLFFVSVAVNLSAESCDCRKRCDNDRPLKVLMVGNSFSICVLEYLPAIAASYGRKLDLTSLYIGGCTLSRHAANLTATNHPYDVRWNYRGRRDIAAVPFAGVLRAHTWPQGHTDQLGNLRDILAGDEWDVVTVQQASHESWRRECFEPHAGKLIGLIRAVAPQAEIVVQETWSYNANDSRIRDPKTGGPGRWKIDQDGMFERLSANYRRLAADYGGLRIIPTGTAVQRFRKAHPGLKPSDDVVGVSETKDNIHLNQRGKYLQALVWASVLFGVDVRDCAYVMPGLSAEEAEALKRAAAEAAEATDLPAGEVVKALPAPPDKGGELAPLTMEPLPSGSLTPRGWLRYQLAGLLEGLPGRLYETSEFLTPTNGWLVADGIGWEEQAYWLRTFVKLAVLMQDRRCLDVSAKWIDGILANAEPDGWFGPRKLKRFIRKRDGQPICDIWPHMVMTEALLSWNDARPDPRIPAVLAAFVRWCLAVPDEGFLQPDTRLNWPFLIQHDRACDIVPSLFRLYGMTGDTAFLALADRLFAHRRRSTNQSYLDNHNVTFSERFAYETVYSRRSRLASHRMSADYWFDLNALCWGSEFPRWGFASDENSRVGCFDARYATETCAWGELVRSFRQLADLTGEAKWCDRIEDVVFNNYPPSFTPDWKRVHYLTAPNQVNLDALTDHNHQKPPPRLAYSSTLYRCCRHNAGLTLPLFAENLVRRTAAGDLVFALYAPHDGALDGADGPSWSLTTRYPFRESVELTLRRFGTRAAVLRIPAWSRGTVVAREGAKPVVVPAGGGWLTLNGPWADEERLVVTFTAESVFTPHPRSHGVTIERGPLSYSLALGETFREVDEPIFKRAETGELFARYPEEADAPSGAKMTEAFPTRPWNYALDIAHQPVYRDRTWNERCFAADTVPCEITARGRRVKEWCLQDNQPAALQESPVATDEPEEELRFIPMGAARCRLCVLPVVGDRAKGATVWRRVPEKTLRKDRPPIISE